MRSNEQLPTIVLRDDEYARLSDLAALFSARLPDVSDYLEQELERAVILAGSEVPPDVVTMYSLVTFREMDSGRVRSGRLVYPHEEDASGGNISVMTPIGVALIGMRVGQKIAWRDLKGRQRSLEVTSVTPAGCSTRPAGG